MCQATTSMLTILTRAIKMWIWTVRDNCMRIKTQPKVAIQESHLNKITKTNQEIWEKDNDFKKYEF